MGPDLQIVVLDMSLEEQMERIRKRHEAMRTPLIWQRLDVINVDSGDCDIDGHLRR